VKKVPKPISRSNLRGRKTQGDLSPLGLLKSRRKKAEVGGDVQKKRQKWGRGHVNLSKAGGGSYQKTEKESAKKKKEGRH